MSSTVELVEGICQDLRHFESSQRLHLISAAAILLVAALFAAGQAPFAPQFNAETFPLQAIPVLERYAERRVFTTDQWADYLLYRFYPGQRVFFDGRSDFYGNDFIKINQRIASAEHDWRDLLVHFDINLVLLKPEIPLVAALKLTPGAKVLFDDGKAIVFDVSGLHNSISGAGNTAKRAASLTQTAQFPSADFAVTHNHSIIFKKGKLS